MISKIDYQKANNFILKITVLCWTLYKLSSLKLWHSNRDIPLVPVFENLKFSNNFNLFIFYLSFLALGLLFFYTQKKVFLYLVFFAEITMCLLDQLRWQPFNYQNILIILFAIVYRNNHKFFFYNVLFLFSFTYIYSGIHKFSGEFLAFIWDNLILKKGFKFSKEIIFNKTVHYSGLILPIIEIILGVLLLFFKKYRKTAIVLLIFMHISIILFLSPLVLKFNMIVIPWNLAMIGILILYFKSFDFEFKEFFKNKFSFFVVFIIGIMPMLSKIELWDYSLSFKLYSGDYINMHICIPNNLEVNPKYKKYLIKAKKKTCNTDYILDLHKFCEKELNVPIIPEKRVLIGLKNEIEKDFSCKLNEYKIY